MPSPCPSFTTLLSSGRMAASVFPDPVGATTRTFSPAAMSGDASTWGGVGWVMPISATIFLTRSSRNSKFWAPGNRVYLSVSFPTGY
jgi:hypothetical protein